MKTDDNDWEDYLFSPPPWPYAEGDPNAPKAYPTNRVYGYDIRQLDSLPVQVGYKNAAVGLNSENMDKTQARQYYSQFELFRGIMLDKNWSTGNADVCKNNSASNKRHGASSDRSTKLNSDHYQDDTATATCRNIAHAASNMQNSSYFLHQQESAKEKIDQSSCTNNNTRRQQQQQQHRRSSTDSTTTAVSTDSDTETDFDEEASNEGDSGSHLFRTAVESSARAAKSSLDSVSFGKTFALLRIPLLWLILVIISVELAVYFLIRYLVRLYEDCVIWRGHRGLLFAHLCCAKSYREYMNYARLLDAKMGIGMGQSNAHSRFYDPQLLERITHALRIARAQAERLQRKGHDRSKQCSTASDTRANKSYEAIVVLCDLLRQGPLKANAGGWENRQIWSRAYSGTTRVVDEYTKETVRSINCIRSSRSLPAQEKLAFFRQVAKQQGRMALCLSGGAAMGWKHLGVARCLLEEARLPRVISGTSAGSVVAAMLATHTDDELRKIIRPDLVKYMTACQGPASLKLWRWLVNGHYFDAVEWVPRAQVFTRGNLTFLEAFRRTGKLLNITCTPLGHKYSPPKLMNYISAPNVIIWSAVMASACLPGVMQPMVLLMKTRDGKIKPYTDSGVLWRDGSFRNDIPNSDLRASFNVKFTVVSQVNPHIALFFYDRDGSIGQPPACRYSSIWRGGFVLSAVEHALKLDVRKWLRLLSDLNLVPLLFNQDWTYVWLQKFDGNITIVPKRRIVEYFQLLLDPTPQSLAQSMEAGTAATWPKVKLIKARQRIEDAITAGWVDAYHSCIKEGHLTQSMSPRLAMVAARADRSADALQAPESDEGPPYAETADDSALAQELLHSPPHRARSNPLAFGRPPYPMPARRRSSSSNLSWNSSMPIPGLVSVGQRTKKTFAQLATPHTSVEMAASRSDSHRSSSLEEDVWTS